MLWKALLLGCATQSFLLQHSASAFSSIHTRARSRVLRSSDVEQEEVSSVEANGSAAVNGNHACRYDKVLSEIGLDQNAELMQHVHKLPPKRAVSPYDVFCNRELKLSGIKAIGFDMDYTLAQYNEITFAELSFHGAKEKLVKNLGYPEEVLDLQYDHSLWTRGLIIDTQRGNFLKIDRHKYVRVAHHGFDRISSTTRKHLYSKTFNKVMSFSEKHFINMDTLFQFVDAHLYASVIELKDKGEHEVLDYKTYEEIYKQIRECVDLCHRDGVIKNEVHRNPADYIMLDKGMVPMLTRFRDEGVKLFLLTNSLWEYTSTAMNFLYHGKRVSDEEQKKNEWLDLFDLVIVGSCKPAYMLDPNLNLFRVKPQDGSLLNTDGVYEIDALGPDGATKFLQQGKTFQGGNWLHLHAMLETSAGEEILYVGDHLYSDVLRSKRTLGWRSAFVMPELEEEMKVFTENAPLATQITTIRQLREELGLLVEDIRRHEDCTDKQVQEKLDSLAEQDHLLKSELTKMTRDWHRAFHPIWGAMFHAGYQDSRFAYYVANYACLYTSRATNLGLASSDRGFRTSMEMLPHDRLLNDSTNTEFVNIDPWE
jgi:5'-nucleotidase